MSARPQPKAKGSRTGSDFTACTLLPYALLIVLTLAVYWPVHRFDFVNLDDDRYVSENTHVQAGLTLRNICWAFTTGDVTNWHPVTWLSYLLDATLWGVNPSAYHLVNLLFHLMNSLLLFEVLRRMTRDLWPSAFVALLFAVHPLHVESVAWVAERKDVLSALFGLLSLLGYVRYVRRPGVRRYLLFAAPFVLGLLSKPMLVTWPCVLLLADYWPLRRLGRGSPIPVWKLLIEKLPLLLFSILSSVITVYVQKQGIAAMNPLAQGMRFPNAILSYLRYLGKAVWPANLAVHYPYPASPYPGWLWGGALVLLLALTSIVLLFHRRRYLVVGWFWYLGTLVPVIGMVQVGTQAMADRYSYIPLVGPFIILAWGAAELQGRRIPNPVMAVAGGAVLLVLSVTASFQVRHWQDGQALYEHALRVTPENSFIHYNLGLTFHRKGDLPGAVKHFAEALRITPQYANAQLNLGKALAQQGRKAEAVACFTDRLRRDPDDVQAHDCLGILLAKSGQVDDAISHFTHAVRLDPDREGVHFNLANLLARNGRSEDAIAHYHEALRTDTDRKSRVLIFLNLGVELVKQGRNDEAMSSFQQLLEIDPENSDAHNNIGLLWLQAGGLEQARGHFRRAVASNPGNVKARENLRQAENRLPAAKSPEGG